jgi:hypothetical protein
MKQGGDTRFETPSPRGISDAEDPVSRALAGVLERCLPQCPVAQKLSSSFAQIPTQRLEPGRPVFSIKAPRRRIQPERSGMGGSVRFQHVHAGDQVRILCHRPPFGKSPDIAADIAGRVFHGVDSQRETDFSEVAEKILLPVHHRHLQTVGKSYSRRFAHAGAPSIFKHCQGGYDDRAGDDHRHRNRARLEREFHASDASDRNL